MARQPWDIFGLLADSIDQDAIDNLTDEEFEALGEVLDKL